MLVKFIDYIQFLTRFFLTIINKTPESIARTPAAVFSVKCSWKTRTPINMAVTGSKEPNIAALVEPISFIETVIVSRDIIVGNSASPRA